MDIVASYEVEGDSEVDATANLDVLLHSTGVNVPACTVRIVEEPEEEGGIWKVEVKIPLGTEVAWIESGDAKEDE